MTAWIDGKRRELIDYRDRGLQYGDGVFETMHVGHGVVRLLDDHLDRLLLGCRRLGFKPPPRRSLRAEIVAVAARAEQGVLKLIVTRGVGARGYRPSGRERCTRILALSPVAARPIVGPDPVAVRVRICRTRLGVNPVLAGMKTLNRLESVLARLEWRDPRIWEGLMLDDEANLVCGTMSNLFLRRGSVLQTPLLDRCGVAGVMRRWVLRQARRLKLQTREDRIRLDELVAADEVFLTNAIAGIVSVADIRIANRHVRPGQCDTADELRGLLASL
jgi:4-amino-4-deoxychorismate lyase